ncbi:MAG: DUF1549 domain-containing protein [Verrucomicrobiae bacterium]|nr:DUF1549 domain-containing protein [Verrucomicrobiae bacterium]
MKPCPVASLICSFIVTLVPLAKSNADDRSKQIDRFIEDGYRLNKVIPNPPASDEMFLRRIYLDVAGRIPTMQETDAFLKSTGTGKRAALINQLLSSEAYVSHTFNYWADILRLQTDMKGSAGYAYAEWLKEAIRENKPYDQFVTELITSSDSVWENGAVGFYLRDEDMPLDHMAYTTQVFLGTRMVCAQCHNHPFDKWKQMDFYKMAAYTYGVSTNVKPENFAKVDSRLERMERRRSYKGLDRYVRNALDDILQPLSYGVRDTERMLQLPKDYQYRDGKPGEDVKAGTPFGSKLSLRKGREGLAEWMTSPENPRFATVIANRLWKRALGVGLIEPLDDFKDETKANNERLMDYLAKLIVSVKFDQREFLRVVYNTRTYQREATTTDVDIAKYAFPGPVLRRMSAEQLWDSLMTITVPAIDERPGSGKYAKRLDAMRKQSEAMQQKDPKEITDIAIQMGELERDFDADTEKLRADILAAREAGDDSLRRKLRKELEEKEKLKDAKLADLQGKLTLSEDMMMTMSRDYDSDVDEGDKNKDDRWKGYSKDFIRASQLPSPAPNGHFLGQFGQSEREVIDGSENEASVAQVLTLLNGKIFAEITRKNALIMENISAADTTEAKGNALFMTMLNRLPHDKERSLIDAQFAKETPEKAAQSLVWALLNTREFAFVQ